MKIDIPAIRDPYVRQFYTVYWPQRMILMDYFTALGEEQYDYRMVDTPQRRSDSPRESLAHVLYVQLVYLHAAKTGALEFKSMGTEHYAQMSRQQLLVEAERIDAEILFTLTAEGFDPWRPVKVPWGGEQRLLDLLYFLRDHEILHIGWNLALMDHLSVPRYESLVSYWGP